MRLNDIPAWKKLIQHAAIMKRPEKHLKHLIEEKDRLINFSLKGAGILYDFSRQRMDVKTMDLLFELEETRKLKQQFTAMVNGGKVNVTENRAALHTAARNFSDNPVFEAFIWDINPFDQFGVELGKILATDIRKQMTIKNINSEHSFDNVDPIAKFYLENLFSGK